SSSSLFSFMIPPPPISTLFPYTTLFRSHWCRAHDPHTLSALERQSRFRCAQCTYFSDFLHFRSKRNCGSASRKIPRNARATRRRSEEHTSELQSRSDLVCRLLLEKKKKQ